MVDLSVLGISVQDDRTPLLLLHAHGTRKVVSLSVSPVEALAVSMALGGHVPAHSLEMTTSGTAVTSSDPAGSGVFHGLLSHELMARLVEILGGRLLAVELPRMTEHGFPAEMVLKTAMGLARLECRPADAIALALRCGAMIRMPGHLLVHAEDLDAITASLPEHVRAVIEAKTAGGSGIDILETGRLVMPPEVEAAIESKDAVPATDPRRHIINAAKKIIEQQGLHEDLEKILSSVRKITGPVLADSQDEQPVQAKSRRLPKVEIKLVSITKSNAPSESEPGNASGGMGSEAAGEHRSGVVRLLDDGEARGAKGPSIRVSLVRQSGKGEAEVLEEFHFPAEGIPKDVISSLGLSRSEAEALGREASDEDRWAMLLRMLSPETKVPM